MIEHQQIIWSAFFKRADKSTGTQGATTDYDPQFSIPTYIMRFSNEVARANRATKVTVTSMAVTQHNEDGSIQRDGGGNPILKQIYSAEPV